MVMAVGLVAGVPVFLWWVRDWGANAIVFHPRASIIAAGTGAALLAAVGAAVVTGARMVGYWGGGGADSHESESDETHSGKPDSHAGAATDPDVDADVGQVGAIESSDGLEGTAILADAAAKLADRESGLQRETVELADGTASPAEPTAVLAVSDAADGGRANPEFSRSGTAPLPDAEDADVVVGPEPLDEDSGASAVTAESIIAAWEVYRRNGDGFFTAAGLQQTLREHGVTATVRDGSGVDAGGSVLVVETQGGTEGRFAVVPSFARSPRTAPEWFNDIGSGALSARTEKIHRLAEGKWTEVGYQVVAKGDISEG